MFKIPTAVQSNLITRLPIHLRESTCPATMALITRNDFNFCRKYVNEIMRSYHLLAERGAVMLVEDRGFLKCSLTNTSNFFMSFSVILYLNVNRLSYQLCLCF